MREDLSVTCWVSFVISHVLKAEVRMMKQITKILTVAVCVLTVCGLAWVRGTK
jgi:hypothetical protein